MRPLLSLVSLAPVALVLALIACGGDEAAGGAGGSSGATPPGATPPGGQPPGTTPPTNPLAGPPAGNPDGDAEIPAAAQAEDVSSPRTVVGSGSPAGCTSAAVVDAVAKGGVITFDCGPDPITITLTETARVRNDTGPKVVIDGGGKVTLSGGGKVRILYMSTCDKALGAQPGNCNNHTSPALTVQNLTLVDGNATGAKTGDDPGDDRGGGGAIYAQGGLLKVVNSRFFNNVCDERDSDLGGGAIRKLDYLANGVGLTSQRVWVVNSTFGGEAGFGNRCANGGALSSIGISWTILNSVLSDNKAVGEGANDGDGGNGGAIYNDGRLMRLEVVGTRIENNHANEGGSAIFFVSNDETGSLLIKDSTIRNNPKGAFEKPLPGFYVIAASAPEVVDSVIER